MLAPKDSISIRLQGNNVRSSAGWTPAADTANTELLYLNTNNMTKHIFVKVALLGLLFVCGVLTPWVINGPTAFDDTSAGAHTRAISHSSSRETPDLHIPAWRALHRLGHGDAAGVTWTAFRSKHPRLALSVELTLLWTLRVPRPFCALAAKCSIDASDLLDLDLSATIILQGRDVYLEDIACGPNVSSKDDDLALRFCECLLADSSRNAHTELPDDVPAEDLVHYQGTIILDHWTMK